MRPRLSLAQAFSTALAPAAGVPARAQSEQPTIELVLETGTPLRVALAAGTRVNGRVARFEAVVGRGRAGAMLNGDFTPCGASL
jgi:hypothetical protein